MIYTTMNNDKNLGAFRIQKAICNVLYIALAQARDIGLSSLRTIRLNKEYDKIEWIGLPQLGYDGSVSVMFKIIDPPFGKNGVMHHVAINGPANHISIRIDAFDTIKQNIHSFDMKDDKYRGEWITECSQLMDDMFQYGNLGNDSTQSRLKQLHRRLLEQLHHLLIDDYLSNYSENTIKDNLNGYLLYRPTGFYNDEIAYLNLPLIDTTIRLDENGYSMRHANEIEVCLTPKDDQDLIDLFDTIVFDKKRIHHALNSKLISIVRLNALESKGEHTFSRRSVACKPSEGYRLNFERLDYHDMTAHECSVYYNVKNQKVYYESSEGEGVTRQDISRDVKVKHHDVVYIERLLELLANINKCADATYVDYE